MLFSWFSSQEESYPLTFLGHNGGPSREHDHLSSLTNAMNTDNPWNEHNSLSSSTTTPMNVDNPWNDVASPSLSRLSMETEPPVDGHATMANALGVVEESGPAVNICETMAIVSGHAAMANALGIAEESAPTVDTHEPMVVVSGVAADTHASTAMPKETMENTWHKAPENTTIAIRSIGLSLGKCSAPKVVLKELDYSSSLHDDLYNFMREQAKEHNELIKAFEGARVTIEKEHTLALAQTDRNVKFVHLAEEHGQVQQELESQDRTIAQQRVALEHLQGKFSELHAKLDSEITRVNAEKGAELAALAQKFSHVQTEKEAELVALAQKFEGAVHQVEVLNQTTFVIYDIYCSSSEVRQDTIEESCHACMCMDAGGISGAPLREVTASLVAEEVVQMLRMDNEHVRELFSIAFSVMGDEDFLSYESPSCEVVMSFAEGIGPGPDPINLQWDFSGPVSSVWNQAVVDILLSKLHELSTEEKWTTTPRSDKYWKEAIKQKFNRVKVIWNKGRPRRLENDILETPAQVATRLMQGKTDNLRTVQKDMRRVAKFHCCSITTKSFLHTEMARGTRDKEVWQWLSDIVDHLGTDGMSSEDSEEEDTQTIFQVCGVPWRREIDKEL
ncbi:hypothetical protein F5141DRAFT_1065614 [Pisolithus sp. B1]|nr:hypothetical protein F5141DRAFT_1065614 [Pisolithus sp. B1]